RFDRSRAIPAKKPQRKSPMSSSWQPTIPEAGAPVTLKDGGLDVPSNPIIPFIEGDGTGVDIWAASQPVFDTAVTKAYGGERRIHWMEVLAGEKSFNLTGD